MQDGVTQLPAKEFNVIPNEIKNAVLSTDNALDAGDDNQLARSIADYATKAVFYNDVGAADLYELEPFDNLKAPTSYKEGMVVMFKANADNTGACTASIGGLAALDIIIDDLAGTSPSEDMIQTNGFYMLTCVSQGGSLKWLLSRQLTSTEIEAIQSFYIDTGSADAYVLFPSFPSVFPAVHRLGMTVTFVATNANTGASTCRIANIATPLNIKRDESGTDLRSGDIEVGDIVTLIAEGSPLVWRLQNNTSKTIHQKTSGSASYLDTDTLRFDNDVDGDYIQISSFTDRMTIFSDATAGSQTTNLDLDGVTITDNGLNLGATYGRRGIKFSGGNEPGDTFLQSRWSRISLVSYNTGMVANSAKTYFNVDVAGAGTPPDDHAHSTGAIIRPSQFGLNLNIPDEAEILSAHAIYTYADRKQTSPAYLKRLSKSDGTWFAEYVFIPIWNDPSDEDTLVDLPNPANVDLMIQYDARNLDSNSFRTIPNGNFEFSNAGVPDTWVLNGTPNVSASSPPVNSGDQYTEQYLVLGSNEYVYQDILTIGESYTLRGMIKLEAGSTGTAQVSAGGSLVYTDSTADGTWQAFSASFTATSNQRLQLTMNGNGACYFDLLTFTDL